MSTFLFILSYPFFLAVFRKDFCFYSFFIIVLFSILLMYFMTFLYVVKFNLLAGVRLKKKKKVRAREIPHPDGASRQENIYPSMVVLPNSNTL